MITTASLAGSKYNNMKLIINYTASVFDKKQDKWFNCNDKAVVAATSKANKKTPYLLFYVQN